MTVVRPQNGDTPFRAGPVWARAFARLAGAVLAAAGAVAPAGCGDAEAHGRTAESALAVTAVFGEVGISPGQFTYPRAIDTDGHDLWIIDKGARVQRIDPATGKSSSLWRMPEWE